MLEAEKQFKKAFSVKSTAALIDKSIPFVRKKIREGSLRAKKMGSSVCIYLSDLEEFLANQPDWKPTKQNGEIN